jgi:hypothetical protein
MLELFAVPQMVKPPIKRFLSSKWCSSILGLMATVSAGNFSKPMVWMEWTNLLAPLLQPY